MTICTECQFHRNNATDSEQRKIWYNNFCAAPEVRLLPDIDPVSGERGFAAAEDRGRGLVMDSPYPYCRNINRGNCPHFVPR